MNISTRQFVITLISIYFVSFALYGQEVIKVPDRVNHKTIEESLLEGLKSDNEGLRISSAYYLGERKSEEAVIPLMALLKNESSSEAEKMMAAVSLFRIGDERGIYAIKGESEYESNPEVKKMCKIFYDLYLGKTE